MRKWGRCPSYISCNFVWTSMKKLFLHHACAVCIFLFPVFARSEFYDWLADFAVLDRINPHWFLFFVWPWISREPGAPARFSSGVLALVSGSQDYFSRWRFSIPTLGAGGPSSWFPRNCCSCPSSSAGHSVLLGIRFSRPIQFSLVHRAPFPGLGSHLWFFLCSPKSSDFGLIFWFDSAVRFGALNSCILLRFACSARLWAQEIVSLRCPRQSVRARSDCKSRFQILLPLPWTLWYLSKVFQGPIVLVQVKIFVATLISDVVLALNIVADYVRPGLVLTCRIKCSNFLCSRGALMVVSLTNP
jgi:hypothetical protein